MFRPRTLTAFTFLSLLLGAVLAATIGPVADLNIVNAVVSPDGFSRSAVLANGGTTGPLIVGNKGDEFKLNVINQLDDNSMLQSTSIHWHGLFQKGSNYADGPSFVSQCPIAHRNSFLYDFSVPDQAGTFWYHSHLSTQYCDGLRGPLVVYDPSDPYSDLYDVDDETTVITLADWYHNPAKSITGVPTPDSTLINGVGRWTESTPAGVVTSGSLAVITVEQGKRYRFRLVNLACDPNFVFSIDGHAFTVIEADGVNHDPVAADSAQIFVGQRYSLILNANQTVDNYWIRANPSTGTTGFAAGINSAILRYVGATEADPTSTSTADNLLLETDLHPRENPGAPGTPVSGGADTLINLALVFDFSSFRFSVNGVSYVSPSVPVLLQILSGQQSASNLLPAGSVYPLPPNKVVEVSIPGGVVGGGHPFHLHGHTFDVIRSAGSSTYNYDNPARRDVVNIGTTGDNVTIRFVTDNAGPWFLHCHIDWHLDLGLAVVFAEDTDDWAANIQPPSAWDNLCPTYNNLAASDL